MIFSALLPVRLQLIFGSVGFFKAATVESGCGYDCYAIEFQDNSYTFSGSPYISLRVLLYDIYPHFNIHICILYILVVKKFGIAKNL